MTIQANQGFGVSIFGATSAGGGSTSPGGSSGQLQYNASGSFGGMAGTSWDDTNRSLTLTGATVTTSQPVLNLSQTWNAGAVTFTGLKFNATDTASASGSLLADLQVGGVSKFSVNKAGSIIVPAATYSVVNFGVSSTEGWNLISNGAYYMRAGVSTVGISSSSLMLASAARLEWSLGNPGANGADLTLTRAAAASLQLGQADAAAPVAQTLQVQSVVAGTSNTAGANWTLKGSAGTGTGAGGSIIFQVAPAGSSGTAQNAYATALTIAGDRTATFAAGIVSNVNSFSTTSNTISNGTIGVNLFSSSVYIQSSTTTGIGFTVSGTAGNILVSSSGSYGFTTTTPGSTGADVLLLRDAANTLALRNGTSAQEFRVYSTYTSAAVNSYVTIAMNSGNCYFGTYSNGGSAGALIFSTNNGTRWQINSNGHFVNDTDNTYDLGGAATNGRVRTIYSGGGYSAASPAIKTGNYSQATADYSLIFNGTGSITLTLLAASTYPGKVLYVKTIAAQTVVSASSNVKPIDSDTAGTAILAATAGKWAMLQSDGTNWIIMAQG